jgi:hypothetical protein
MVSDTPHPGCPECGQPIDATIATIVKIADVALWPDGVAWLPQLELAHQPPDDVQVDCVCSCGWQLAPNRWEIA